MAAAVMTVAACTPSLAIDADGQADGGTHSSDVASSSDTTSVTPDARAEASVGDAAAPGDAATQRDGQTRDSGACESSTDVDLYVSPSGDDAWSGHFAVGCPGGDGPFRTLARARDAVRALRQASPSRATPVRVVVRGGTYELADTLVFGPEDSGTPASPTEYVAYPGETPVVSGGQRLTGFAQVTPGRWELTIPDAAAGGWPFMQLFVDGVRRFRPRLPKMGVYRVAANGRNGTVRWGYDPADMNPGWSNIQQIEVKIWLLWHVARQQIVEIGTMPVDGDASSNIVLLRGASFIETQAGDAYVLENVRDALSDPGEWYLDRNTGVLTYLSEPAEDPNASAVVAPRLEQIVRVDGGAGTVSDLHFSGLTFSHAEWRFDAAAGYESRIQAEADPTVKAAVSVQAAHDIVFEGCTFSHVGAYALDFGRGAKNNRVADSTLTDLGAGGVRIGEVTREFSTDEQVIASGNTVTNNTVEHGGRVLPGGVGILVGHAHHNQIDHNDVDDFYYSGISVGWNWEFLATPAHDNVIEYNHVSRIGQGLGTDLGGIYAPGVQPGTVIRNNRVQDVSAGLCGAGRYCYSAAGIYLDNAASNMVVERNLVYGVNGDAVFDHGGEANVISNNVLDGNTSFMRTYDTSRNNDSGSYVRNIMVCRGLCTYFDWEDARYTMDNNVYFRPSMPVLFSYRAQGQDTNVDFATWASVGWRDANAIEADPLFLDLAGGDYHLQPGSPALGAGRQGQSLGIEPLPIDAMGRQR